MSFGHTCGSSQVAPAGPLVVHRHNGSLSAVPAALAAQVPVPAPAQMPVRVPVHTSGQSSPQALSRHGSFTAIAGNSFVTSVQAVSAQARPPPDASMDLADVERLQSEVRRLTQESAEKDARIVALERDLEDARQSLEQKQCELELARAEADRASPGTSLEQCSHPKVPCLLGLDAIAEVNIVETDHSTPASKVQTRVVSTDGGPSKAGSTSRRGSVAAGKPAQAKDDIDLRLSEFLEQTDCALSFRRKNKGWYTFQYSESGTPSATQCVELSLVNGKLMVKVEAETHHGHVWNNGKRGSIERFVAAFSRGC